MRIDDILLVAIPCALAAFVVAGALWYAWRAGRAARTPRVSPSSVLNGAVAEGALVRLVGVADGETVIAPWSASRCVAWLHVFTLVFEEDHPSGARQASITVEHRESGGLRVADSRGSVRVSRPHAAARALGLPIAARGRWSLAQVASGSDWLVGRVAITPPAFDPVPGTTSQEIRAEELVVPRGHDIIVVGVVRRDEQGWGVVLEDDRCAITGVGIAALGRADATNGRALGVFAALSALLTALGVVALWRAEPRCEGELEVSSGRPSVCCVSAAGARRAQLHVAPHVQDIHVRVWAEGLAPVLELAGQSPVHGEDLTLAPTGEAASLQVSAVGGAPLPGFCVRLDAH